MGQVNHYNDWKVMYAEIIYGVYWKLPEEEKENAEKYEAMADARCIYKDGDYTIYYGLPVMTLADHSTDFDEMHLLRMLDLKNARLTQDLVDDMKRQIQSIPLEMRDHFTAPRFYVLWGE